MATYVFETLPTYLFDPPTFFLILLHPFTDPPYLFFGDSCTFWSPGTLLRPSVQLVTEGAFSYHRQAVCLDLLVFALFFLFSRCIWFPFPWQFASSLFFGVMYLPLTLLFFLHLTTLCSFILPCFLDLTCFFTFSFLFTFFCFLHLACFSSSYPCFFPLLLLHHILFFALLSFPHFTFFSSPHSVCFTLFLSLHSSSSASLFFFHLALVPPRPYPRFFHVPPCFLHVTLSLHLTFVFHLHFFFFPPRPFPFTLLLLLPCSCFSFFCFQELMFVENINFLICNYIVKDKGLWIGSNTHTNRTKMWLIYSLIPADANMLFRKFSLVEMETHQRCPVWFVGRPTTKTFNVRKWFRKVWILFHWETRGNKPWLPLEDSLTLGHGRESLALQLKIEENMAQNVL